MKPIHSYNINKFLLFLIFLNYFPIKIFSQSFEDTAQVKIQKAEIKAFSKKIELTGSIKANESVDITPVISEKIKKINFKEGSRIKKDQVLIIFENKQEKAELKQVEAELQEVSLNFERAKKLLKQGNASQAMLDKRLMEKKRLEGKSEEILAKLADLTIKSPLEGFIGIKNYSEGSFIKPGDIITKVFDIKKVKIDLNIPEVFINEIYEGQKFSIKIPSLNNKKFTGVIFAIDPFVSFKTRTFRAIGIIEENKNFSLIPGMMGNVIIDLKPKGKIMIPEGSIIPVDDKSFVFVVNKELIVNKVEIKTGIRLDGLVEVKEGINTNDSVVYEGTNKLNTGKKVKILE